MRKSMNSTKQLKEQQETKLLMQKNLFPQSFSSLDKREPGCLYWLFSVIMRDLRVLWWEKSLFLGTPLWVIT